METYTIMIEPKPRDLTQKGEIYDFIVFDTRYRRWRQIATIESGQSVLFRWGDFLDLADLFHSVRDAACHYRKKCNLTLNVHKTKDGIFVSRPFDDDSDKASSYTVGDIVNAMKKVAPRLVNGHGSLILTTLTEGEWIQLGFAAMLVTFVGKDYHE